MTDTTTEDPKVRRALDANARVARIRQELREALRERDTAVVDLAEDRTPGQVARLTDMSTSNVRIIVDRARWSRPADEAATPTR